MLDRAIRVAPDRGYDIAFRDDLDLIAQRRGRLAQV